MELQLAMVVSLSTHNSFQQLFLLKMLAHMTLLFVIAQFKNLFKVKLK